MPSPVDAAPGRIDTHHHVVPPFYRSWLVTEGVTAGGREVPEWSPAAALEFMEATAVRTAVLSVSTPGVGLGDAATARSMARDVNDYCVDVRDQYPGRFGFFATVMQPDLDSAVLETHRALDDLGAEGVVLLTNVDGVYLGDGRFDPLMAALDARSAVVFVHPSALPAPAVDGIPPYVADFLLDTTRAAINLARSGTMERFPRIRFILSHAGGFLPFAASRVASTASPDGRADRGLDLLRRFYFDTALSGTPTALPSLLAFADPDHVLYGSDFPYAPAHRSAEFTASLDAYADIDHAGVDWRNAAALFPGLRAEPPARVSAGPAAE